MGEALEAGEKSTLDDETMRAAYLVSAGANNSSGQEKALWKAALWHNWREKGEIEVGTVKGWER